MKWREQLQGNSHKLQPRETKHGALVCLRRSGVFGGGDKKKKGPRVVRHNNKVGWGAAWSLPRVCLDMGAKGSSGGEKRRRQP